MSWSLGTTCGQKSSIVNRASYTTILDKVTVDMSCGDLFLYWYNAKHTCLGQQRLDMYFEKKSLGNKTIYLQLHFCLYCPNLKICFMKKRSPLDFFKETLILGAFFRSMAQLWVDINGFWYYRPTKWRKKKSDIRRKHLLIRNFVLLSGTKGWADMQCLR